ncbi:DUF3486 family protein [Endozoicomonas numazuensis]|uniref:Mu-like prophage FluMu protein gp27 n=1 Tax=Endozoicomonas numazuensis TaxID=1137799 RepID=A0A081NL57_9GAMM|nr:DUF3486 family protein [Endozoicomonas numazuensis]KEQ19180.1 hypothetical protein GZ78_04075 [Endozoicomonas numazuensis]
MTDKKAQTRNRKSRIKLLPKKIKEELDRLIREGRMTQTQILDEVNQLCEAHGENPISQSGMSRYSKEMDEMGQQIRELREVSSVWVAKLGEAPTSDVGKMLLESVRTLAADVIMEMRKDRGKIEPKALNQLALVMQRVEQAAMASHKRETEIRKVFAEEAANTVTDELRGSDGMSEQLENRIREILLGKA